MSEYSTEGPFRAEVVADSSGKFYSNALRFPTAQDARAYAINLAGRWTLVREWRVMEEGIESPIFQGPA